MRACTLLGRNLGSWSRPPMFDTVLTRYPAGASTRQHKRTVPCRLCSFSSQAEQQQEPTTTAAPSRLVSILEDQHLIESIPLQDVRNFCFIAHVDHGKSSLSSRLLEWTGNLGKEAQRLARRVGRDYNDEEESSSSAAATATASSKEQIELLDTLAVEQQRGITVKASTATMLYPHPSAVGPSGCLLINMIDTPGHVDFGKEVVRSLSFVQGAVLLLDAAQGIQAQTWSVYEQAKAMQTPPELLIALTKVDLDAARPIHVALTVSEWLEGYDPDEILLTSARNRIGTQELLDAVCSKIPPPTAFEDDNEKLLRAQVVDSWYDSRGVNCLVQIVSGELKETDRISIIPASDDLSSRVDSHSVQEVGLLLPRPQRTGRLLRGQLGYVRFGLRDPRQAQPGTLLTFSKDIGKQMQLPHVPDSSNIAKSVLYASVHPTEADGFDELCDAVDRLALNDTGLEVSRTSSVGASGEGGGPFLGPGLRVGFQGLLHVEIFRQRLQDEFGVDAVVTPPKVPYTVTFLPSKKSKIKESYTKVVEDLLEWPGSDQKYKVLEPIVSARIMARVEDAGPVMELITRKRGTDLNTRPIDEERWMFTARIPWAEIVTDFHDQLKNVTEGYGSLDTSTADPPLAEANLAKVDILLNGEVVAPLSFVCHKDSAQGEGREVCQKLQGVLPRQQFVTVIQAKAGGKVIASERIRAYRKDVLTKSGKTVGGGDVTRKMKLLEKQKKGKKRMQESSTGRVALSQEAFNSVISRSSS